MPVVDSAVTLPRPQLRHFGLAAITALAAFVLGAHDSPAQDPPIIIGAMYNLTGAQQNLDVPSSEGAKVAVDETNRAGGVLNRQVKLILRDGQTDPKVIARETAALFKDEPAVAGLIGLSDTDMVLASAPIGAKNRRVFVTSGATTPTLVRQVPRYLFLACFGDNVQAAAGAEWAFDTLKARKVVVLYKESSSYTRALHRYFETRFKQLGGKVLTVRSYVPSTIPAKVKGLPQADLVYLAAQPDETLAAIKALRAAGIEAPILGGDGLDLGAAWRQAPDADKIYFTTHAYLGANSTDIRVQRFREAFARVYPGREPDAFTALGYDAARLLMAAISAAGSTRSKAMRKALAATKDFAGVTGTISYRDGSRIPTKPVTIMSVLQGRERLAATVLPKSVPAP
jgi:branched-chain amino acid transport system substrate-binding protein